MSSKAFYKTWSFWLLFIALILALGFFFFGGFFVENLKDEMGERAIYSSAFFISILVINLLYLLLSKEENRERREKILEAFWLRRKEKKEQKQEEQKLATALRKKFNNAKDVIRNATIYGSKSYQNYDLPWYLVIGEEQSKKASILRNSGLDFPVNINYKDSEYTDNKDDMSSFRWFFAEEGVFINVPSAYISTDKDRLEQVVWDEFLRLFKKERWRRPVNGIILTLNVEKFSTESKEELREYAKVLRARFDEVSKAFFSKIPIYVVLSGLESVDGFYEYFNTLSNEEKREILGVTFDENLENINENTIATKFSLLQRRLEGDKLDKLYREFDVASRAKTYFFDESFRELLQKVTRFNAELFSKTRFHAPLMLRGIYFTSVENKLSKGIFLPKVFDKIILSESNLVMIDKGFKKRYTILQWLLVTLLATVVLGSAYYWLSFLNKESSEVPTIERALKEYQPLFDKSIADIKQVRDIPKIVAATKKRVKEIGKLGGTNDGSVSFKVNSSELTESANNSLIEMISKIKDDDIKKIKILGHTDSDGTIESNKELSHNRAKAVKRFFIAYGINKDTIVTEGKGESKPIADNSTEEGKEINRRVEIMDNSNYDELVSQNPIYTETEQDWTNIIQTLNLLCLDANCTRDISFDFWKPGYRTVTERDESIKQLYHKNLNVLLLNAVKLLIERELLDNLDDRARITYNLKAYLLLRNQKKRDENPEFLQEYMQNRWGEIETDDIAILNKHFETLLSLNQTKELELNNKSIKKARGVILADTTLSELYYHQVKLIFKLKNLKTFRFEQKVKSPEIDCGSYEIAGIYTREGYWDVVHQSLHLKLHEVLQDNWILGETEKYSARQIKRLYKEVLRLYFEDYKKEWNTALSVISFANHYDSEELEEQLETFSSIETPVLEILRVLKRHTSLPTLKNRMEELPPKLAKILGLYTKNSPYEKPHEEYKAKVRKYYGKYFKLIDENNLPSGVLKKINKILRKNLDSSDSTGIITEKSKDKLKKKFRKLPIKVKKWYEGLLNQNWSELGKRVKHNIEEEYVNIHKEYDSKLSGRFPLNARAKKEVEISYFVDFFKKDGIWDSYYKHYEEEVNSNSSIEISKKVKNLMHKVKKIRELMFNESETGLEIVFDIKPTILNQNYLNMELQYKSQSLIHEINGTKELKRFSLSETDNPLFARFKLTDLDSMSIIEIKGKGKWALLKLLYKLNPQRVRSGVVSLSSSGNRFLVKGKSANLLLGSNILQTFKLKP